MDSAKLLRLFDGLRVADVRDGMDWVGLHFKGSVSQTIRPLYQGAKLCGIARTVRHRLTEKTAPAVSPEEYTDWAYNYWYKEVYRHPFAGRIEQGEVIVIESPPGIDAGEVGSNNSLDWHARGAVGIVTSGGVRDTDECIMQQVPIFCRTRAQSMAQARIEFEADQVPVNVGGVLVRPGDVVVGDGDGVIAVPVEHAEQVAAYARQELENDKVGRRRIYERLGRPLDDTVR